MKISYILLLSVLFLNCDTENNNPNPINIEYLNQTIQYKSISGIDSNLLSLDIYHTNDIDTKKPIVFYVHGGGWVIGDKSQQLQNKINLFRELGYILVSINYRLSPYPYETTNPNRIKYPDHTIDVTDALKWVYKNIDQYGGNNTKIALLGHSAGAHLVALTGTNRQFVEQVGMSLKDIKGVAVIDTKGFDIPKQATSGTIQEMYINAFGVDVTENIDASPIYNIFNTQLYPKFFIAKRGNTERINSANAFINMLEANGINTSQVEGSIYTHAGINNAIGAVNETLITNALKKFFVECFE
ncbi:MAG: alpha/beta hydrolase [Flavobacteriaceae bacterium]|nr:alpha/beta hydrolase [Flavobacteriaceae bacterium]